MGLSSLLLERSESTLKLILLAGDGSGEAAADAVGGGDSICDELDFCRCSRVEDEFGCDG